MAQSWVQLSNNFECKILVVFLPNNLNICFGAHMNRLNETVLLSTNNTCLDMRNKKNSFSYAHLSGGLLSGLDL